MATLFVQNILLAGIAITTANATETGDEFANPSDERTFLRVTNGSGGAIDVTIPAQQASVSVAGFGALPVEDIVVNIANGATKHIGPFPAAAFNNASGRVEVEYSEHTSVTVAAVRLARA